MIFLYARLVLAHYALKWLARLIKWTVTTVLLVAAAPPRHSAQVTCR